MVQKPDQDNPGSQPPQVPTSALTFALSSPQLAPGPLLGAPLAHAELLAGSDPEANERLAPTPPSPKESSGGHPEQRAGTTSASIMAQGLGTS